MTDVAPLFRPFRIRGLELKNRVVMAPMTRARSPGAFPNDHNVAYYARRAAGHWPAATASATGFKARVTSQ